MNVYKTRPEEILYKIISRENFEEDTLRKYPWYQTNDRGKEVHFAVCPACDNPIQIIGLYRLPRNLERPYGKHLWRSIPQLAEDNPEARENCPYFKPRQHRKTDRRTSIKGTPLKILRLLIIQFDRVCYLLGKHTGIVFSRNLLRKMLQTYRSEEGYLYTGATLMNVPWIFAYMADSQSLFGQRVGGNHELVEAIRRHVPAADIDGDGRVVPRAFPDGEKRYFSLNVCFIHHRQRRNGMDGALVETMKMIVSTEADGKVREIHRETLTFDHQHFRNLINLPDGKGRRRLELVELAREVLGDLCGLQ